MAFSSARVLHNFQADEEGELTIAKGERVMLSSMEAPEGWVIASKGQESGLVPLSYVKVEERPAEEAEAYTPAAAAPAAAALAAEDVDLSWLAGLRHSDPEYQSWLLEAAARPAWAEAEDAAAYAGSGWFHGDALYSFEADVQEGELEIEAGETLLVRCDEPAPDGWRHAARSDGSVGLVVRHAPI
jgi:hypothetical protein